MARRTRLWLASGIVGILSVAAAFRSAAVAKALARQSPDPYGVQVSLARFAPVAARLAPGGPIGFLTDLPEDRAIPVFLQTQYALAPRLLISLPASEQPEFAVGIFSEPVRLAESAARHGYLVEEDLGYGLVLLRRK